MSSSRCQCLTKKGDQCSKPGSKKPGQDPRFCWQHQNCDTPMTGSTPTKKATPKKKASPKVASPKKPSPKKPSPKKPSPKKAVSPKKESFNADKCQLGLLVKVNDGSALGSVTECQPNQLIMTDLATAVAKAYAYAEVQPVQGIDLGEPIEAELCEEGSLVYCLYDTWIVYGQIIECLDEECRIQAKTSNYEAVFKAPYGEVYLFLGQDKDLPLNSDDIVNQKKL